MCGGTDTTTVEAVPTGAVWDELERQCQVDFGADTRARLTTSDVLERRRCRTCGLDHVSGGVAGDAAFYTDLGAGLHYYEQPAKWEFHRAAKLVRPGASVLDIGCGEGVFAAMVAEVGGNPQGVDASEHSRRTMAERGFACFPSEALIDGSIHHDRFDIVTAFQVVEHLEDPRELIASAAQVLKPGGVLLVTVPNRDRLRASGLDPFDWPPHHVTRWGRRQLEVLLAGAGLVDLCTTFERRHPLEIGRGMLKGIRVARGRTAQTDGADPDPDAPSTLTRLLYGHTMMTSARKPRTSDQLT